MTVATYKDDKETGLNKESWIKMHRQKRSSLTNDDDNDIIILTDINRKMLQMRLSHL